MQIQYLKQNSLDYLKSNLHSYLNQYNNPRPWIASLLNDKFSLPSNLYVENVQLKQPSSSREHHDLENTIILYESFKNINPIQASDERIWAYLTHITFWDYMCSRWHIDNNTSVSYIKEHYFITSGNKHRSLLRNGISRLWWYGYVSYDEDREDKFELTKTLLTTADIAQNLLERQFSRNKTITKSILSALTDYIKNYGVPSRQMFRRLMKYVSHISKVTIIDSLDEDELLNLILNRLLKEQSIKV